MNSSDTLVIKGKRKEIEKKIQEKEKIRKVVIKVKPSKKLFLLLLSHNELEEVEVSEGIYKAIGQRYWKALEKVGIKVAIVKQRRGRKGYPEEVKKKILNLLGKKPISQIAREMGVSRRAIHYWKKRLKT